MMQEFVEVSLNGRMAAWYASRGYKIPTRQVQLYAVKDGRRIKNGVRQRVERGAKITVRTADLMPASNVVLTFACKSCGNDFTTTYGAHQKKVSENCKSCQAKNGFKGGCHSYWVEKLITSNPNAACDISGERDRRFLQLHHLLSRSLGGKDEVENYVILSANYHLAFHNWMGGTNVPTKPEDYFRFKQQEKKA